MKRLTERTPRTKAMKELPVCLLSLFFLFLIDENYGGADLTMLAETSPAPCDNADDQSNDEEWTIVPHPNADMRGVSSEVDLRIGWGKWRYSLLSWAVRVGVKRDQSS